MAGSYIHNSAEALIPGSRPATARYVIYLNMTGAMSHLDTFGTNPEAPDIQGPTKSIPTSADGVFLSENLGNRQTHAQRSDYRTMSTGQVAHEQASYLMHTSYLKRGTIAHPTFGSWVSKLSGNINTTIPMNVQIGANPAVLVFLNLNMVHYL